MVTYQFINSSIVEAKSVIYCIISTAYSEQNFKLH